tara:strand:- start:10 stop:1551 length:1542 start_codon:yes stop_codon:yes gene_type:complete
MAECLKCRYLPTEENPNQQSCSRWVKNDAFLTPCPDEEREGCEKMECPGHCQYPFSKEAYKPGFFPNNYFSPDGELNFNLLSNNLEIREKYLADFQESLKDELKEEYSSGDVPDIMLKCGNLHVPEEGDMDPITLPSSDVLNRVIEHYINLNKNGINWSAVKRTDGLEKYIEGLDEDGFEINIEETEITVNLDGAPYTIDIADNGIEVEWWDGRDTNLSEEELMSPLPAYIREHYDLLEIHKMTGGILQNVFPTHTVDNMVIEEVYDWLKKNNLERESIEVSEKFTIAKFFGIRTDQATNRDFEICMNQLLMTEHDDEVHLKNIDGLTNLTELGDPKNRKDLLYVEAKIIKFLIIDPKDIRDCLDIVYITDEICEIGLTSNPTQMMGNFLKLNTDNVDDEKYDGNMRIISKRLLKYIPDIIEKIIELAEYYEKQKCNGEIHKNTKLLKEIHSNLFKKNTMVFDFPSLGISEFFRDFQENIITKVILLFFIAYMITQFIKLFRVNVNLSGGKGK